MVTLTQPPHARYPVRSDEDVGVVRRAVAALAGGIAGIRRADAEIVATELASNIVRHSAGGGYVVCGRTAGAAAGIELLAVDHGPGIPAAALAAARAASALGVPGAPGAPGTTGTPGRPATPPRTGASGLGVGLASVLRLAPVFDCVTGPAGTAVLARFGVAPPGGPGVFACGGVSVPLRGAAVSGDAWAVADGELLAAVLVDGLGHGPAAAAAAAAALTAFGLAPVTDPAEFAGRAHRAMRGTRGGVASVCVIDPAAGELGYAGVGNVSARLLSPAAGPGPQASTRLLGRDGMLGTHLAPPAVRVHRHPWTPCATLVLASDGIGDRWDAADYPGLFRHDPTLAAAVLYRDHEKGTDDATVLVIQDTRDR